MEAWRLLVLVSVDFQVMGELNRGRFRQSRNMMLLCMPQFSVGLCDVDLVGLSRVFALKRTLAELH
jgi:hypothetical protein